MVIEEGKLSLDLIIIEFCDIMSEKIKSRGIEDSFSLSVKFDLSGCLPKFVEIHNWFIGLVSIQKNIKHVIEERRTGQMLSIHIISPFIFTNQYIENGKILYNDIYGRRNIEYVH